MIAATLNTDHAARAIETAFNDWKASRGVSRVVRLEDITDGAFDDFINYARYECGIEI